MNVTNIKPDVREVRRDGLPVQIDGGMPLDLCPDKGHPLAFLKRLSSLARGRHLSVGLGRVTAQRTTRQTPLCYLPQTETLEVVGRWRSAEEPRCCVHVGVFVRTVLCCASRRA